MFLLCTIYTFCNYLTVLGYSILLFFSIIIFLHFNLGSFIDASLTSLIFTSTVSSLLMSPSKISFILLQRFFISSSFCVDSFLDLSSLCLYYSSVLACCLLFFMALNTFIIVILNPLFTIPKSVSYGSDACFVSPDYVSSCLLHKLLVFC